MFLDRSHDGSIMGLDDLFKPKKQCPVCTEKVEILDHELRLDTSEGLLTLTICATCADFLDKSAEILKKSKTLDIEDDNEINSI